MADKLDGDEEDVKCDAGPFANPWEEDVSDLGVDGDDDAEDVPPFARRSRFSRDALGERKRAAIERYSSVALKYQQILARQAHVQETQHRRALVERIERIAAAYELAFSAAQAQGLPPPPPPPLPEWDDPFGAESGPSWNQSWGPSWDAGSRARGFHARHVKTAPSQAPDEAGRSQKQKPTPYQKYRARMLTEQFYGDRCGWGVLDGEEGRCLARDQEGERLIWDHLPELGSRPGSHLRRGKSGKRTYTITEWRSIWKAGVPDPTRRFLCQHHERIRTARQAAAAGGGQDLG